MLEIFLLSSSLLPKVLLFTVKQVKERERLQKVRREKQRKLMEEKKNEEMYESKMMDKIKNHLNTSMKMLFAVKDNDVCDFLLIKSRGFQLISLVKSFLLCQADQNFID